MTVARGINVFSTRATAEFRVQRCCAHPGRSLSSQRVGPHRAPSMPRRDMSAVRRHPRNVLAQASLELKERGIRFDPSQVKTLRLLGEGSFGSVYEVTGSAVARCS